MKRQKTIWILVAIVVLTVIFAVLIIALLNKPNRVNITAQELLADDYYDWQDHQDYTFRYNGKDYQIQPIARSICNKNLDQLYVKETDCGLNWSSDRKYCDLFYSTEQPNYYLLCLSNDSSIILLIPKQRTIRILGDNSRPLAFALQSTDSIRGDG